MKSIHPQYDMNYSLTLPSRFLWVNMQFQAILDVCEDDGTPDRIPELFADAPQKVTDLYRLALLKLSKDDTRLAEIAKKVFQWVIWGTTTVNNRGTRRSSLPLRRTRRPGQVLLSNLIHRSFAGYVETSSNTARSTEESCSLTTRFCPSC